MQEYDDDQIAIPSPSISTKESLTGEVEGSQETNQIKNIGEYFLDPFSFLKLPLHLFDFELSSFPHVVQAL